jgi:hypothetical protein
MDTVKVDLGDNEYALMYDEMRHGTSRKVQAVYEPYVNTEEAQELIKSLDNGAEGVADKLHKLVGSASSVMATDVMILGQVEEWSFGEISQEVLDNMPERKRRILSDKCDELYARPLAMSGGKN